MRGYKLNVQEHAHIATGGGLMDEACSQDSCSQDMTAASVDAFMYSC